MVELLFWSIMNYTVFIDNRGQHFYAHSSLADDHIHVNLHLIKTFLFIPDIVVSQAG